MTPATLLFLALAAPPQDITVPKVPASYETTINRWADYYQIPRGLAFRLMLAESNGDPLARSREWKEVNGVWKPGKVLARGLFQISVQYEAQHAKAAGVRNFDWRNPDHSARVGLCLLRWLLDRYGGDQYLAVAAFNCGFVRLESGKAIPLETLKHLDKVFGKG